VVGGYMAALQTPDVFMVNVTATPAATVSTPASAPPVSPSPAGITPPVHPPHKGIIGGYLTYHAVQGGIHQGAQAASSTVVAQAQQQFSAIRSAVEAEARANATVKLKERGLTAFKLSLGRVGT
jgi:hypothetical protein